MLQPLINYGPSLAELNSAHPQIYVDQIRFQRPDGERYQAAVCFSRFEQFADLEAYKQGAEFLHPRERVYYEPLKFERRKKSYLLGRLTAKQAIAALTGENSLSSIFIQSGVFSQPVVVPGNLNIQVSITHCDDFGAALAFPEVHPVGIDLEAIDDNKIEVLERQLTAAEQVQTRSWKMAYPAALTLVWTAKEALSKVLKTGLTTPFEIFELCNSEFHENYIISYYKNFAQYKVRSFALGAYLCSIAYPAHSELQLNVQALQHRFA